MITKEILRDHGCTAEDWRKKLEFPTAIGSSFLDPEQEKPKTEDERITRLRRRIRSRVEAGRNYNFANYRLYHALDIIWTTPFRQVNPTLLLDVIKRYEGRTDSPQTTEEINKALKSLGLDASNMFIEGDKDPKTGQPTQILNVPVFLSVTIPLVQAYLQIRRAKLFNDRNIRPFLKIESLINSAPDRTRCEVLTSRIQTMADQYGYLHSFNQALFMFLLYGQVLQFTLEEWHFEQQKKYADAQDVAADKAKEKSSDLKVESEMTFTVKEGLRFYHPHPTRTYWDPAHPMWTLNTGTGCEYAGFWRVLRWKDIESNPDFYNKHRVSWGPDQFWTTNLHFFNAVYNTCCMDWPAMTYPEECKEAKDREAYFASNAYYGESRGEQAVVVTEHREIVNPEEDGLGDYPHPIWARFVIAGDGTIVYAAPCCYTPVSVMRDNGDDRRMQDSSLGLKLVGFQDQISNLMTQFVYAAKQNLANVILVDKNVVDTNFLAKLQNLGERMLRKLNFFEYDSKQLAMRGLTAQKAFDSHRFPPMDTNGIMQALKACIDLAERVLQFSSQEVAQAATHEQTKAEMDLIKDSTTNILRYTGFPVDDFLATQTKQIYEALMAHGDDDFYAIIPHDEKITQDQLKQWGITYVEDPAKGDKKVAVRAKRSALLLFAFAYAPAAEDRKDNIEVARMISEFIRDVFMNNPVGLAALGPDQLIDLGNQIAKFAGLPFERPLRNASHTTEQAAQAAQEQLKALVDQVLTDMKKGIAPVLDAVKQNTSDIAQIKAVLNIPQPNAAPTQPGAAATGQSSPVADLAPAA